MSSVIIEPERICVGKKFSLVLRRTLRVPDSFIDGRDSGSPLPPNLGPIPIHTVEEYRDHVPSDWLGENAAFMPLREREALWLDFQSDSPHAVKVSVGGVNAVTGLAEKDALEQPQNYLVCPPQQWLDGVRMGRGKVRQFVSMPLGQGYSIEGQVTGKEQQGGIQVSVYRPKKGLALKPLPWMSADEGLESLSSTRYGIAAGGEIAQRIHPDPYGLRVWDQKSHASVRLHLIDAETYRQWTGAEPPYPPPTAEDYTAAGLPWFELLDEAFGDIARPRSRRRLRSVAELDRKRGLEPDRAERPLRIKSTQLIKLHENREKKKGKKVMSDNISDRKEKALRLLPDLEALNATLQGTPEEELAGSSSEAPTAESSAPLMGFESVHKPKSRKRENESDESRQERQRFIGAGRRAVSKLAEDKSADLTREEQVGLEAIVMLTGRPALLVQNGKFADPVDDQWAILSRPDVRAKIETNVQSVGRIEVTNHPAGLDWIGTGFLVADDVVMTNRHVAVEFCATKNGKKWNFLPKMKIQIDYVEEYGATTKAEFNITEVIGIHDEMDMALLRVSSRGSAGAKRPKPLPLAAYPTIQKKRKIYVVGYPASDSRRNDPVEMRRIFENIFDVKRLQPGEIMKVAAGGKLMDHDCSTLGGNSGSCLIDLETHQVIGLHFRGKYLEGNTAIVLSKLATDPLLKKAKLEFV